MTHRWIDPVTGAEQRSDDSPGSGWLAVVLIDMPDGSAIASTPQDIAGYLDGRIDPCSSTFDSYQNVVSISADTRADIDNLRQSSIMQAILRCPYFRLTIEYEGDDGVVADLSMDPNANSLPPFDFDSIADPNRKSTLLRNKGGGGGGRPVPTPPPVIPWDDKVPFPSPTDDIPGPQPSDQPLEPSPDMPQQDDISDAAQEQADTDSSPRDGDHVPGGDIPCPDCNGTGEESGDGDGDDGDQDSDSGDGDMSKEEEDLLKDLLGIGDDESDSGGGDGDQDSDSGDNGDDEGGSQGKPGECDTCGGSGSLPEDDGDGDEDEDDNVHELLEAANAAIEAANAAIAAYKSNAPDADVEALIASSVEATGRCHELVEPRSVIQRSILRRAVEAAKRALDLDDLMERGR